MLDESESDPLVVGVIMLIFTFPIPTPEAENRRIRPHSLHCYTFHFKQVGFFRFGVEGKPTPKTVDCG
jgi:hypothetical protein